MAIGDRTDQVHSVAVELLASATAANGVPSAATDGLDINLLAPFDGQPIPDVATLLIYSTAGSDTMTVTCRLWGYSSMADADSADNGGWFPLGTGTAAGKGVVNDGAAIAEDEADTLSHAEPIELPAHFDRLYLEVQAIGGTSTAVTAQLVVSK